MTDHSTKSRLILAAAELFRMRGYHGVGVTEILERAKAPKGSLYHHFPNGKADLAIVAAEWASDGMVGIIDEAFREAPTYADGATTLCHKLAKFFDLSGGWDGCPVSSILLDGPENDAFRAQVARSYETWVARVAQHGTRLGLAPEEARFRAETLLIAIQGAWTLARARKSSDVLRGIPARILA
ncbi:TetR/AcrR family transcriptional regulator [Ovoidimarina sediminis]|uniref:TetR/AcrR family transcriptional regulator n=1 Tax=Ovoidimarina sediminis TaxID=3079856 RepID=UPI0029093BA6|nr:TetR/AcrR family transcriptional regulator [Rhodophyticola sp. MJ-SS7]MDU8944416.1 TetR/AcrR family transcriptional regulator [Rhodophyticola sp. MJ-SS7]